MKKILTFLFCLIVIYTNGQVYIQPNSTFGTQEYRRALLSTFHYPTGCGVPTDSTYLKEPGIKVRINLAALYYDSCGHHAYNWDPALRSWALLGSGSGGGVDSIYNRTDSAFYRLNGVEEFAFLIGGDTTNLSHRIDTLSTIVFAALAAKIGNFLGVSYIGYGSHAARPTSGTGLYYDTDSASFFRVNGASYTNLFPSFNVTVLGKGGPGDTTLVSASGGNLLVAAVRDSTGGCIGHVVNPDGSWTLFSTCALKNYWDSVAGKISPHGSTDTVIVNRLVVNNRIDQTYTNATAGAFNQTGFNGTDRNNAIGTTGSTINGIRRAYTPNGSTFNLDIYNAFISDMSSTPSAVINTGTGYSVLLSGSSNWGAQNGVSIINGGGTNRKAYATNLSAGTGNYAFYSSADAVSLFGGAVGINQAAPSASSLLDIISTSKGVLIPRMTNAQMLAITSPSGSLLVFNTDSSSAVTGGYYYFDGLTTTWRALNTASGGGSASVITDKSLLGIGTSGNPLKIDSGLLANHLSYDTLRLDTLGVIVYDTLYTGLVGNYYSQNGTVSATISGGNIVLANTTNNDYGSYLATVINGTNYSSMLPAWNKSAVIKLTSAPSSTTYGIGVAKLAGSAAEGWIDLTTGANAGKIFINQGSTNLVTSSTALTFSQNDVFRMRLWLQHDSVYFTVANITTGATPITVSYAFNYVYAQTINPPQTGFFGIIQKGGAYVVLSDRLACNAPTNPPLVVLGNSKAQGDFSGSTTRGFVAQLNSGYTITVNLGGSGDMVSNVLTRIGETIAIGPKEVLLEIGSNSLRNGIEGGLWRADYKKIVDTLTGAGIKVYHTVLWEGTLDQTPLVNFIDSFYHSTFIRGPYDALQTCGTSCLVADLVHPNGRGHDSVYANLVRDGRLFRGNYRLRGQYLDLRKLGVSISPASKMLVADNGTMKTIAPSLLGLISKTGNTFNANTNTAASILALDGGEIKTSTADVSQLLANGGNTFTSAAYVFGTKGAQQLQMLYNGVKTISFQSHPQSTTFYGLGGSETARLYIDSLENLLFGKFSFQSATTGVTGNTGIGSTTFSGCTTCTQNTYIGAEAGSNTTTAALSVHIGFGAGHWVNGFGNTLVGGQAAGGQIGTTFQFSTGIGEEALYVNKGDQNTAIGYRTLHTTTTAKRQVSLGDNANTPCPTCDGEFNIADIEVGVRPTTARGINGKDTIMGQLNIQDLPDGTSSDSVVVSNGRTLKKILQSSIGNGSGVTRLSPIDSIGVKNSAGANIAGNTLVLQSADAGFPGLVTTGGQTFAGIKTFTASGHFVNSADIELNSGSAGSLFVSPVDVSIGGAVDYSSVSFTASFSINMSVATYAGAYITAGIISSGQTITLPSSGASGRTYKIVNANTGAGAWTFAGTTLKDGLGNTVTSFPNGYTYEIFFNGATWDIKTITGNKGIPITGSYSNTGTATTTFTVTMGITEPTTTYKVNVTPTDMLGAALFYVTNKTATTFDVVYLSGLTGTVSFDWTITP